MDRDRDPRLEHCQRLSCPFGIEMTGAEPGAPSPDRHERRVERPEVPHPGEQVGVAGEVDGLRPRDDEAERVCRRPERKPPPIVRRLRRPDRDRTDRELVSDRHLDHLACAGLATHEWAGTPGNDERNLPTQPRERGEVEVVVVDVRDEHCVDASCRRRGHRHGATQVRDTPT